MKNISQNLPQSNIIPISSASNVILAYFYCIFKLNFVYIFALETINHRIWMQNWIRKNLLDNEIQHLVLN